MHSLKHCRVTDDSRRRRGAYKILLRPRALAEKRERLDRELWMALRFANSTKAAMVTLLSAVGAASAADLPSPQSPSPAVAPVPIVDSLGFFVRFGVVYAINTSSSKLYGQPALGAPETLIVGANAHIADVFTAGAELGYFVTNEISLEIAAGIPVYAKVKTVNTPANPPYPLVLPGGTTLGSLMPSFIPLTVNYHFTELGAFQPYVGAGIAPVFSLAQKDGFDTNITFDPTVGLLLQTGARTS